MPMDKECRGQGIGRLENGMTIEVDWPQVTSLSVPLRLIPIPQEFVDFHKLNFERMHCS